MKKIKELFEKISPENKIKYISIVAVAVVICVAVGVVFAINQKSAPKEAVSTESLTIEYDEEIVLDFDNDESDAVSESVSENTDPEEVTDTESAGSTEDTDSTEETADAESTDETVGTTDTAETPSEDTEKTDPEPETKPAQTTAAVTKPAQTTAAVTKPVQTTAPATKPAETTAPVTQKPVTEAPVTQPVTTKPSVDEPEEEKNHGNWVIKQKKYYYNSKPYVIWYKGMDDSYNGPAADSNVVILNVENKSNEAYTITIKGNYLDASGNVIKTETKTFEGFAANWSNYFVFAPNIKFEKFTFEFSAKKYNAETYVQYFERYDKCGIRTHMALDGGNGRESYYAADGIFESAGKLIAVDGGVRCGYTGSGVVDYTGYIVLFDKNGELVYIRDRGKGNVSGGGTVSEDSLLIAPLFLTDIPYSEIDSYKIPDNLTSVTGFFAIETFSRK